MKNFVRIENGRVVESLETDGDIAEMFHPSLVWLEISDSELTAVNAALAAGKQVVLNQSGRPEAQELPKTTFTAEQLASHARALRDSLLAQSDWTQLGDSPLSEPLKQSYKVYRTALRALPKQPGFPTAIVWPEAPK
jgi:DNA-binding XRE family transcriptional regulator